MNRHKDESWWTALRRFAYQFGQGLRGHGFGDPRLADLRGQLAALDGDLTALRAREQDLHQQIAGLLSREQELDQELSGVRRCGQELELHLAASRERQQELALQLVAASEREQQLRRQLVASQEREQELALQLATLRQDIEPALGLPLPLFLTHCGRATLVPEFGKVPQPLLLLSVPKAGTYLLAEILRLLGSEPTHLHLAVDVLSDYRGATLQEQRDEYTRFTRPVPMTRAARLIQPGQFAVGHLPCSPDVKQTFEKFKKVFICRDLRDCLVSMLRFAVDTRREAHLNWIWDQFSEPSERLLQMLRHAGPDFIAWFRGIAGWQADPAVFKTRFETLQGDKGTPTQQEVILELGRFLDCPVTPEQARGILDQVLGTPTKTWSGRRSNREEFWNSAIEQEFESLGGRSLNEELGYKE
jgi:hypothetical protein